MRGGVLGNGDALRLDVMDRLGYEFQALQFAQDLRH
jgi:hypothetical protein